MRNQKGEGERESVEGSQDGPGLLFWYNKSSYGPDENLETSMGAGTGVVFLQAFTHQQVSSYGQGKQ